MISARIRSQSILLLAALLCIGNTVPMAACTRLVYTGANGDVITARSMDWSEDVMTNLWIFPRGMHRNGDADFSEAIGKIMKLDLGKDQRNIYSGNVVKDFRPAQP